MKFQTVYNPRLTMNKMYNITDIIHTDEKSSNITLIIVGDLFINGIENNMDLYERFSGWISIYFKHIIIVPGKKDLYYNKNNYKNNCELFTPQYMNITVLINDVYTRPGVSVYGGIFEFESDDDFLNGLHNIETGNQLIIVSLNVFRVRKIRYVKWVSPKLKNNSMFTIKPEIDDEDMYKNSIMDTIFKLRNDSKLPKSYLVEDDENLYYLCEAYDPERKK